MFYDENNNIVRLGTWQKMYSDDGSWKWFYACYVDYTYDERNLRTSRTNYNDFDYGVGFDLGGVYRYYYDEEGRMTSWALEFFGMEEYQKAFIEYDEEGRKISETMLVYSFETYALENDFLTEYEYDDNGNVVREAEFSWNAGMWEAQPYRVKEYDEFGNCILEEHRTGTGSVQDRKVYSYDTSILAKDVFYYSNPEDDYPQLPKEKTNLLKSFEYYTEEDNAALAYVTTYVLDYEVIESDGTNVEEVAFASSIYPNPAQDFVMVESSEANYVEVVDVYGRVMFSSEMNETVKVDMSGFASGIYFVKLQAGDATSVQKIMKK